MLYIILILILFMPRIKQMTQNLPAYIQVSFFFLGGGGEVGVGFFFNLKCFIQIQIQTIYKINY